MMRQRWFTFEELWAQALPDFSRTKRSLALDFERTFRQSSSRRLRADADQVEYDYRYLPLNARIVLVERFLEWVPFSGDGKYTSTKKVSLKVRELKVALRRLYIVLFWHAVGGHGFDMKVVAKKFGVSRSSIYRWAERCRGFSQSDYFFALLGAAK